MKSRSRIGSTYMPYILTGAFVLAVIIVIVIQFVKNEDQEKAKQDDSALAPRITRLEERLGSLEAIEAIEARVVRLENQWKVFEIFMNRYESTDEQAPVTMDELLKRLKNLEKKAAFKQTHTVSPKTKEEPKKVKTEVKPKKISVKAEYHVVGDNDTLYSISRKYGITVDALRRMNSLGEGDAIHPNQKLMVRPPSYK